MRIKRSEYKTKHYKNISKGMIIFIAGIIICAAGYAYSLVSKINSKDFPATEVEAKGNEPINILVAGMDIGDTENLDNKEARRTDTIMVVNYNPLSKKMNFVSIPRDTMIEVDAYDRNFRYRN